MRHARLGLWPWPKLSSVGCSFGSRECLTTGQKQWILVLRAWINRSQELWADMSFKWARSVRCLPKKPMVALPGRQLWSDCIQISYQVRGARESINGGQKRLKGPYLARGEYKGSTWWDTDVHVKPFSMFFGLKTWCMPKYQKMSSWNDLRAVVTAAGNTICPVYLLCINVGRPWNKRLSK